MIQQISFIIFQLQGWRRAGGDGRERQKLRRSVASAGLLSKWPDWLGLPNPNQEPGIQSGHPWESWGAEGLNYLRHHCIIVVSQDVPQQEAVLGSRTAILTQEFGDVIMTNACSLFCF